MLRVAAILDVDLGLCLRDESVRRDRCDASYMGMESAITATRSVDIVGPYEPLESGFHYAELGVVPKPVSAYK